MKKMAKVLTFLMCAALAFTFWSCDNPASLDGTDQENEGATGGGKPGDSKKEYHVTYLDGVDGETITVPTDSKTYKTGETVNVIFSGIGTRTGYEFKGWKNGSKTYTSSGTKSFTMGTANVELTALWTQVAPVPAPTYTITIAEGIEHGTVSSDKDSAAEGDLITLTASPASGYKFNSWNVKDSDNSVINVSAGSTFIMPAKHVTVNASFEALPPDTYSITITGGIAELSSGERVTSAAAGTIIYIAANLPDIGKEFTLWESESYNLGNFNCLQSNAMFTMPAENVIITATYHFIDYSITVDNGISNGSISVPSTANYGETVTITANPSDGYALNSINVTNGGASITLYGEGNTRTFLMPADNVNITASFVKIVAPTKTSPTAVGDIVLSDGTYISLSDADKMSAEQKQSAVAVIFDVSKKEGVGLKEGENLKWASSGTTGTTIKFNTSENDGSDSWAIIKKIDSEGALDAATNYPAFNWANSYSASGFTRGWYLPAINELKTIYSVKDTLNNAINKIGTGTNVVLLDGNYRGSTDSSANDACVANFGYCFMEDMRFDGVSKDNKSKVRAVRVFDNFTISANNSTSSKTSATSSELITVNANVPENKVFVKWTSNPEVVFINENAITTQFAMPAGNVIITPIFRDKTIGTKKRPTEVGDIVFNDGTALPATEYNSRELTDREKQNAIAVVGYVYMVGGSPDNCITVGLKQEYTELCTSDSQGNTNTTDFSNVEKGFDNKSAGNVRDNICNGNGSITDYSKDLYPAFWFAQHYTGYGNLGKITNDWLVPNLTDLILMYAGKDAIINAISKIGSDYSMSFINPDDSDYFTVTQHSTANMVYLFNLNDGSYGGNYKGGKSPVLVIRYFQCHD